MGSRSRKVTAFESTFQFRSQPIWQSKSYISPVSRDGSCPAAQTCSTRSSLYLQKSQRKLLGRQEVRRTYPLQRVWQHTGYQGPDSFLTEKHHVAQFRAETILRNRPGFMSHWTLLGPTSSSSFIHVPVQACVPEPWSGWKVGRRRRRRRRDLYGTPRRSPNRPPDFCPRDSPPFLPVDALGLGEGQRSVQVSRLDVVTLFRFTLPHHVILSVVVESISVFE